MNKHEERREKHEVSSDRIYFTAWRASFVVPIRLEGLDVYIYLTAFCTRKEEERKSIFDPDIIFPVDRSIFLTDETIAHCWF